MHKTLENNWSRAVLLNYLDTDLYERQGKAVSNFDLILPEIQSDLAQAITNVGTVYLYKIDTLYNIFLTVHGTSTQDENILCSLLVNPSGFGGDFCHTQSIGKS